MGYWRVPNSLRLELAFRMHHRRCTSDDDAPIRRAVLQREAHDSSPEHWGRSGVGGMDIRV
ncbi:unnamed protein product [Thlaspi arvense]|uniref:Uncharacterized protein n=1 Tax=Thlaspi arvense TaxID=13288 RepID=A0AAU9S311_THLAR|nr:unnamed protein product [Thlaspi arvense]